jgi:hypothetical protein
MQAPLDTRGRVRLYLIRPEAIIFFGMRFLFVFICCWASFQAKAQGFQPVFSALQGQELLDSLVGRFKPDSVLNYANARDTLYGKILAHDDDSIRCIYSGHTLYLDPTQDPTQYIYLNGASDGMNTEHAYPQAKGAATGNARSDMHHLYPARIPVNEARGNLPYGEIPDAQTQKWYFKNQVLTTIPGSNINAWSEYRANNLFEPRESVKGDLARSVFYFYTMYKEQADLADPAFFELQRPTLCQWNQQDPADGAELLKTWRIAPYQENKPNPFVLDCTLAFRTYCPQTAVNCLSAANEPYVAPLQLRLSPNPGRGRTRVHLELPFSGTVVGILRNAQGVEIDRFEQENVPMGAFEWEIQLEKPTKGVCFLEIRATEPSGRQMRQAGVWMSE